MNIFVTDISPTRCARDHCDKHVVKMILETAQLLSSAVLFFNSKATGLYKNTHVNHPCSKWARESRSNFEWLYALGLLLCDEYTYRYGNHHKSRAIIENASLYTSYIPDGKITPFAQAMPEDCRESSAVFAYREYIFKHKIASMKFTYTKRNPPKWLVERDVNIQHDGDICIITSKLGDTNERKTSSD